MQKAFGIEPEQQEHALYREHVWQFTGRVFDAGEVHTHFYNPNDSRGLTPKGEWSLAFVEHKGIKNCVIVEGECRLSVPTALP